MKSEEDLVQISSFANEVDAELAKTKLESAGIDAYVSRDDAGGMEPQLQWANGVRLYVLESKANEAREVLDAADEETILGEDET